MVYEDEDEVTWVTNSNSWSFRCVPTSISYQFKQLLNRKRDNSHNYSAAKTSTSRCANIKRHIALSRISWSRDVKKVVAKLTRHVILRGLPYPMTQTASAPLFILTTLLTKLDFRCHTFTFCNSNLKSGYKIRRTTIEWYNESKNELLIKISKILLNVWTVDCILKRRLVSM